MKISCYYKFSRSMSIFSWSSNSAALKEQYNFTFCLHPYICFLHILKTNRKTSWFLFSFTTDLSRDLPHFIFSLRSPFDKSSATYHNLICNHSYWFVLKRIQAKRILESLSCTFDMLWFNAIESKFIMLFNERSHRPRTNKTDATWSCQHLV